MPNSLKSCVNRSRYRDVVIISTTSPKKPCFAQRRCVVIFLTNITYIPKRHRKTSALAETNELSFSFLSILCWRTWKEFWSGTHTEGGCAILYLISFIFCMFLLWGLSTSSITRERSKSYASKSFDLAFYFSVFHRFSIRISGYSFRRLQLMTVIVAFMRYFRRWYFDQIISYVHFGEFHCLESLKAIMFNVKSVQLRDSFLI